MMTYVKSSIEEKPDFVTLHTGTDDLRSNADPEGVANSIVDVTAKGKWFGSSCFCYITAAWQVKWERNSSKWKDEKTMYGEKYLLLRALKFQSKLSSKWQETPSK